MSIIPSPSSRQMKNNISLVQYNDEIISKSISRAQEGLLRMWAGIIGLFSHQFKLLVLSLEVVVPLAPIFHFLTMQVSEYVARFVSTLVAHNLCLECAPFVRIRLVMQR